MSIKDELVRLTGVSGSSIGDVLDSVDSLGGGGTGGILVVGVTQTTGDHSEEIFTLDKTWQEIHDAIVGGKIAYVYYDETDHYIIVTGTYADVGNEESFYGVEIATNFGANVFNAPTADGYPQYISI